jgi:FAD/FMN-containing dehydrogenase
MGPAQTDLVRLVQGAQGTMGIVTWGSVKLEVMPQMQEFFFVPDTHLSKLVDFTYRVLRPKLGDEFLILNAHALAAILGEAAGAYAPFTLIYSVSGYEYFPERRVAYQERDIAAIAQAAGITLRREIPGANGRRMRELLQSPSSEPYWKLRPRGAFQDIFFLTTLDRTSFFVDLMSGLANDAGYPAEELGVYIQPIQHGRSCHMEFQLFYDPGDEAAAERVRQLFLTASRRLAEEGAFFSRPYGPWAEMAYDRCPDTVEVLRTVKGIFDPGGVMNQGKLCF